MDQQGTSPPEDPVDNANLGAYYDGSSASVQTNNTWTNRDRVAPQIYIHTDGGLSEVLLQQRHPRGSTSSNPISSQSNRLPSQANRQSTSERSNPNRKNGVAGGKCNRRPRRGQFRCQKCRDLHVVCKWDGKQLAPEDVVLGRPTRPCDYCKNKQDLAKLCFATFWNDPGTGGVSPAPSMSESFDSGITPGPSTPSPISQLSGDTVGGVNRGPTSYNLTSKAGIAGTHQNQYRQRVKSHRIHVTKAGLNGLFPSTAEDPMTGTLRDFLTPTAAMYQTNYNFPLIENNAHGSSLNSPALDPSSGHDIGESRLRHGEDAPSEPRGGIQQHPADTSRSRKRRSSTMRSCSEGDESGEEVTELRSPPCVQDGGHALGRRSSSRKVSRSRSSKKMKSQSRVQNGSDAIILDTPILKLLFAHRDDGSDENDLVSLKTPEQRQECHQSVRTLFAEACSLALKEGYGPHLKIFGKLFSIILHLSRESPPMARPALQRGVLREYSEMLRQLQLCHRHRSSADGASTSADNQAGAMAELHNACAPNFEMDIAGLRERIIAGNIGELNRSHCTEGFPRPSTLLTMAVVKKDYKTAQVLVDSGAGVNFPEGGWALPLHWAVHGEDLEMLKILLDCEEADVRMKAVTLGGGGESVLELIEQWKELAEQEGDEKKLKDAHTAYELARENLQRWTGGPGGFDDTSPSGTRALLEGRTKQTHEQTT